MVAWKRFPVPEFNHDEFKDMSYTPPAIISQAEASNLITKCQSADEMVYGGYAVMPDDALFDKYAFKGEHRHAILCLLPNKPVQILGRSYAWPIQRALVLNAIDPETSEIIHDWKTPRPMNTRLGPEDGATWEGGPVYILTGHKYSDHWISNRSIIQGDWNPWDGDNGFRILSSSDDELDDFHDCYLSFRWSA